MTSPEKIKEILRKIWHWLDCPGSDPSRPVIAKCNKCSWPLGYGIEEEQDANP